MSEWIAVSEQLPEDGAWVLGFAVCDVHGAEVLQARHVRDGRGRWESVTDNGAPDITHWRPLPDPPLNP